MRIPFAFVLFCGVVAGLEAQQRDTPAIPATGSGTIAGQVVSDDATPRPIRRAIVTITGDLAAARSVITDDEGRFAFGSVPAGRFGINATKAAYLPASLGALRPGRLGTQVQLAQGEQATVTIRMARGGVISGRLTDQNGAPMANIGVTAVSARSRSSSSSSAFPEVTVATDDRGLYRVFGLAPGEYLISATPRIAGSGPIGTRSTAEVDALFAALSTRQRNEGGAVMGAATSANPAPIIPDPPAIGFAAVYYPGTSVAQDAAAVKIDAGEERAGVDFAVAPVRTSVIEGTITGPVANLAVAQVSIVIAGRRGVSSSDLNPVLSVVPGPDGSFMYTNVSPGRYTIMARADRNQATPAAPSNGERMGFSGAGPGPPLSGRVDYVYAVADLDVRGEDITGVALSLQPGSTFAGRVRFDGAVPPAAADLGGLRVGLSLPGGTYYMTSGSTLIGNTFNAVPAFTIGPDGSFTGSNIAPGAYTLTATLPAAMQQKWWLRSAVTKGRDLLDGLVQVLPGEIFPDVVLTFTDRHSELSGALQSPAGVAAPEYFVVVFPEDRALWTANAKRVLSTRPATDGKFSMRDLPAGDYLMAALIDLEPGDLDDVKFLEALVPAAVPVRLADGEKTVKDLRVAR